MDSGKDSPPPSPDRPLMVGELKPEQRSAVQTLGPNKSENSAGDAVKNEGTGEAPKATPKVSRRGFIGAMAALAGAVGLGAWGGEQLARNTTELGSPAETPAPNDNYDPPLESSPPDPLAGLAQNTGSSTPPNPNLENPVPADNIDSGNIYVKDASGKRPDGTYEPIDPEDPDKPFTPTPATIDGSGRGEDGSDTLPMMPRKTDEMMSGPIAKAETGESQERNPLPVKGSGEAGLPMMPKGPDADVVAQAPTGASAERNPPLPPSENQTEPLPKMGPRDDDPVNA